MYQLGYLIGAAGVIIVSGTVVLLPIVALFFLWKKRVREVLPWGFTTLPVNQDQGQERDEQKEAESCKKCDESDGSGSEKKPAKRDSENVVLIYVAGVPIEIPRSVAPGHRPVFH